MTDAEGTVSASGKRLMAWLCTREECLWKWLQYRTNISISPVFSQQEMQFCPFFDCREFSQNVSFTLWWGDILRSAETN